MSTSQNECWNNSEIFPYYTRKTFPAAFLAATNIQTGFNKLIFAIHGDGDGCGCIACSSSQKVLMSQRFSTLAQIQARCFCCPSHREDLVSPWSRFLSFFYSVRGCDHLQAVYSLAVSCVIHELLWSFDEKQTHQHSRRVYLLYTCFNY